MGLFQQFKDWRGSRPGYATRIGNMYSSYTSGALHKAGMNSVKEMLGFAGKEAGLFGRAMGPAWLAYSAYQGYQEGGAWGATKATGKELGFMYAWGAIVEGGIMGTLALPAALAAAGAGAVGYQYAKRQIGRSYMKRHAGLEMGAPVVDPFGTVATMRQRSLMAMNNSRINGRSALGNEAMISYSPYYR